MLSSHLSYTHRLPTVFIALHKISSVLGESACGYIQKPNPRHSAEAVDPVAPEFIREKLRQGDEPFLSFL